MVISIPISPEAPPLIPTLSEKHSFARKISSRSMSEHDLRTLEQSGFKRTMAANVDTTAFIPSSCGFSVIGPPEEDSKASKKREGTAPFAVRLYVARGQEDGRRCKELAQWVRLQLWTRHALMGRRRGGRRKWRAIKEFVPSAKLGSAGNGGDGYYVHLQRWTLKMPPMKPALLVGLSRPSERLFKLLAGIFGRIQVMTAKHALEYAMGIGAISKRRERRNLESIESEFEGREIAEVAAVRASLVRAKAQAQRNMSKNIYQSQLEALKNRFADQRTGKNHPGSPTLNDRNNRETRRRYRFRYTAQGSLQAVFLFSTLIYNRAGLGPLL